MKTILKHSFIKKVILPIYHFLISLKLAVTLILLLMAALTAGTFIESFHGANAAKLLVYDSPFLSVLLTLLGLNVLTVALSRLPWKKKHTGFLLTHLGIIFILAGSLVTRYFMIDGQMVLQEGESSNLIHVSQPVLEVHEIGQHFTSFYQLPSKPFPWEGREKIKSNRSAPLKLTLLSFYPKANVKKSIRQTTQGPAALEVRLHNTMMNEVNWLKEGDPVLGDINLGPARIVFAKELRKVEKESKPAAMFLNIEVENKSYRVDLPSDIKIPYSFSIEKTPYKGQVQALYRHAVVGAKGLMEQAQTLQEWNNPAIQLSIQGPDFEERQTVFSNFPDFQSIHGHASGVEPRTRIFFHPPHADLGNAKHELRFVQSPEGGLLYQIKTKESLKEGKVRLGEDVETGWMGLQFNVTQFYPHAEEYEIFEPRPNTDTADGLTSAIQIEIEQGADQKRLWLQSGMAGNFSAQNKNYQILFGGGNIPLGFTIHLKDFVKKNYPGTNKAASFSSDIELIDPMRGLRQDVTISMNKPLEHRGYKIYQSGFRSVQGHPELSIFSVGKDPGVPLKYAGALILVSGIMVMIFMKKISKHQGVAA